LNSFSISKLTQAKSIPYLEYTIQETPLERKTTTPTIKMTSLYEVTVPLFIQGLENLSAILAKGVAHAKENSQSLSEQELFDTKLYPDMAGLAFQIQRVSDTAKNSISRISNNTIENVAMEDNEASFEQLQARVTKTIEFLKTVKPENVNGNEGLTIKVKLGPYEPEFKVKSYVFDYAIPNFFFHISMAYAILRTKGVPVGKLDFLGNILQKN
jgi:hypothetical protein